MPVPVSGDAIATAVRDATALNSVNGSGWTADLTFKGMAAGGVLNLSGAKAVSLDVTRKGFNTADQGNFGFTFAQRGQWQFLYRHNGFIYATNCTFGGVCHPNNRVTMLLGCIHPAPVSSSLFCGLAVGNRFNAGIDMGTDNAGSALSAFIGWNELFRCGGAGYGRPAWGKTMTGFAFVSNVVEVRDAFEPALQLWADGNGQNVDNLLFFHNTLIGGRMNGMYTASGISATGMGKRGDEANNICSVWNTKTETFRYAAEGGSDMNLRTGNWEWVQGVDRRGCIVTSGDSTGGNAYNTNTWAGEVQPPKSRITATVLFADDKSGVGPGAVGGIGTGLGNYRPTSNAATNHAIGVVDQLWGMLRFDLDGSLRAQDGSGAAGAYERI